MSTGGRRRGHAWKEPVGSCWYPAPRTEKGTLTLSPLDGTSRSFIWCKLAVISGHVFHHRALISELSFPAVLFSARNEGKTEGLERIIPHLPTGEILLNKLLFLSLEGGCLFLYNWGRLLSFSKSSILKQRHPQSQDMELEWPVKTHKRNTSSLFEPFLFGFGFSFVHFFFPYDRVKVLSHQLDIGLYLLFTNPSCYPAVCANSALKQSTASFSQKSFVILGWTCPSFVPSKRSLPQRGQKAVTSCTGWCLFLLASGGTIGDLHLCGHSSFLWWKKVTGLEQELISYLFPNSCIRVSSGNWTWEFNEDGDINHMTPGLLSSRFSPLLLTGFTWGYFACDPPFLTA